MSGNDALILSPLLKVANVLMPKSIPIELPDFNKCSADVSTTKLAKYLVGAISCGMLRKRESPLQSLIIVRDVGWFGNFLDQTILILPTFGR